MCALHVQDESGKGESKASARVVDDEDEPLRPQLTSAAPVDAGAASRAQQGASVSGGAGAAIGGGVSRGGAAVEDDDELAIGSGGASDEGGLVTKDMLVQLLNELRDRIQEKLDQLKGLVEDGIVERDEVDAQLQEAIPDLETELREKYGVSQEEVLASQERFSSDASVMAASRALRDVAVPEAAREAMAQLESIELTGGSVPADMTPQKLAGLMEQNADITIRKMNEVAAEIRAKGIEGELAMREFQQMFLSRALELTTSTFRELGISPADFGASMDKYGGDETVMRAQAMVQMRLQAQQQMIILQLIGRNAAVAMMQQQAEMMQQ
jgi:hypothetical protein